MAIYKKPSLWQRLTHTGVNSVNDGILFYNNTTGTDSIISPAELQLVPHTLAIYANNAAAVAGGLVAGQLYRTGADPDVVCVVH